MSNPLPSTGLRALPLGARATDEWGVDTVTSGPTRARRRAHRAPRSAREIRARIVGQALVLALVVAGTTSFATLHKTITLDVDGSVTTVSAFGRTVNDVLDANGVSVGERDLVVPAPQALVADGAQIVVRHGRDVVVEIDGEQQTVWSTALTVEEVLAELGVRGEFRSSVARSGPVGRDVLRVSTMKTVHVAADGRTSEVATTASTVREVLSELGMVLGEHDLVSVSLDAAAVDGLTVMITRVAGVTRSETVPVPFEVVRQDDPTLARGREVPSGQGRDGSKIVTYTSYEAGGVEVGRTVLAERVVVASVNQVIRVGTFTGPDPSRVPPVEPGTARAIGLELVLARGWDEAEFACLDALFTRESNWRVNAENPSSGAYGIPQALPGSKMATVADDWRTNPVTQITWGLNYISGRYGTPCGAWAAFQVKNWY